MSDKRSNGELVKELLEAFSALKNKMEDPNYVQLEGSIKQLIDNQNDMKSDMSELKTRLLNPYDGAIVEIRKNTEFRHDWEKQEKDLDTLKDEHRDLVRRQATYTKIFWTMFTTTVGVLAYIVTNILNK
jgi:hypothetical protein|tara:strand:+ start:616 stop:1002 length:387 start_codon:yes stop_codon:yes gene_type:complete